MAALVEQFEIGRTNADNSHLRLKIETENAADMEQLLSQLRPGLHARRFVLGRSYHGGARLLRTRRLLFDYQP